MIPRKVRERNKEYSTEDIKTEMLLIIKRETSSSLSKESLLIRIGPSSGSNLKITTPKSDAFKEVSEEESCLYIK